MKLQKVRTGANYRYTDAHDYYFLGASLPLRWWWFLLICFSNCIRQMETLADFDDDASDGGVDHAKNGKLSKHVSTKVKRPTVCHNFSCSLSNDSVRSLDHASV